jgi:predicted metal-dependent hydrolase
MEKGKYRFGDTVIEYSVIRSPRRKKTIEITLDPREGVLVAVPLRVSKKEIEAVVSKRASWIVRKATDDILNPRPREFVSGESLPYLGREVRLFVEPAETKQVAVKFDHWNFRLYVPEGLNGTERLPRIRSALTNWYRRRAAERLPQVVERWRHKVGHSPSRILIRSQSQRWGSCAADGTIRLNWRIIMAEPALIDYLVVHELTHLGVQNHSRKFWNEVARVMPDYMIRRQRLKEIGSYLSL